jgi:tetratricopeptide (TPR) repeat protein
MKPADLSSHFAMTVEATEAQMATSGLLTASVSMTPSVVFGWIPKAMTEGDERRGDLALSVPYQAELVYEVHPAPGFVIDTKPTLPTLAMGPASLESTLEERPDGVVAVRYRFVLPRSRWTAQEVNDFRKAYDAFGATDVPSLALVHQGKKLHTARQFEQELDVYRKDVQSHPQDAAARMRLAQALLDLGFGTTARRLASEAMKLAPDDGTLWGYAAYIRSRDLLGRAERAGWDQQGAIAAYREALRVDPTSAFAATNLSLMLEYNAAAQRYAPGSRLDEAVAALDSVPADKLAAYDGGSFLVNPIFDLLRLGRYDDMRARIAKMDAKKAPHVPSIVAAGVEGGPNGALSEAARIVKSGDNRAQILEGAANILVELRRYPEAAALLSAAADQSSDERLRHRAEVMGKTRKLDVASLPVAHPPDVVRKATALCVSKPPTLKDDLRPLLSKRLTDDSGYDVFTGFCTGLGETDPFGGRAPAAIMADFVESSTELAADGSDALGYRVQGTSGEAKYRIFVVREGGAYQIRGTDAAPSSLGCEALTMLKAGRTEAAAKWLTWARELHTPAGGDDPLRDWPFLHLWTDAKQGKDELEVSAAALCAEGGNADQALPPLRAARAKASGDRLTQLDYAITLAFYGEGHEADRLAAATQLLADSPTSKEAIDFKVRALAALGRFSTLRDDAAARVASAPTDVDALWALARAEAQLGHFKEAQAAGDRLLATGKAGPWAYNEQAWRSLFTGTPTERERGYALRAVNANPKEAAPLNTLAALDVALGHIADAQERFFRTLELRKNGDLDTSDWYVLGRIAEQLGLPDEARAAYEHATPAAKSRGQYTAEHLIAARLKALPPAAPGASK